MKFELYRRRDKLLRRQWRWRLRADNGRIIAHSGEGYHNRRDAVHAIALVLKGSVDAVVEEVGG